MSLTQSPTAGLPLFKPPGARQSDPDTSHIAAERHTEAAGAQRKKIMDTLRNEGPQTADSLDSLIGWRDTTAGRRLKELLKADLVVMTDVRADTRSGRPARVWKLKSILADRGTAP